MVAVISVLVTVLTVARTPFRETEAPTWKPPPRRVTEVPPLTGPVLGEILLREKAELTPAWVTAKVSPAIVMVPAREAGLVFGATEKATSPFPLPLLPEVMVIQESWLTAVQPQPVAVTVTWSLAIPLLE